MTHLIIIAITLILEVATLFVYGLDSALIPLWAGIAGTLVVTSSLAKVENDDPDNWEVAIQAAILFVWFYLPLAFGDDLYTWARSTTTNNGKLFVALIALSWCGPFWIYLGRPGRHIWPMSFIMGVVVCAFPGGLLRWGLDWANNQTAGMMVGGIFLTAAATAMVIFVELKLMEFLSDLGWFFFNCKVSGSVRYITRGDKLKFIVCNRDGVFRQVGIELPDEWPRWLEQGDFVAIRRWKRLNGVRDAVIECVPFLLAFPGVYVIPLLAKERKIRHPFIEAPRADVEHKEEEKGHGDVDLNPASCVLTPVPDVDIRKTTETGQVGREVDTTVGGQLRVSSPSAIFSLRWEEALDHAWDGLTSALGRRQGPNLVGYQGPISGLYEQRPAFAETFLSVATPPVPGTPELEEDFDEFRNDLEEVGITPADDDHILVKNQVEAAVVEEARDLITRARVRQVTAPMDAATMSQTQTAIFNGLLAALGNSAAGFTPEQRSEILARAVTFMFMGDGGSLAALAAQFGAAGIAFQAAHGAAAPTAPRGGGRS